MIVSPRSMTRVRFASLALLAGPALCLSSGCDRSADTTGANPPPAAAAPQAAADGLPAGLIVAEAPAGAKGVAEVKQAAKEGDDVVVRARVGGEKAPLIPNRAVVTVIDAAVPTCDKVEGDACKTPWDACCEPPESRLGKTATIRVVGPDGRPVKVGLGGAGGLAPNKEVVVAGKVSSAAGGKTLVVDAAKIYVVP